MINKINIFLRNTRGAAGIEMAMVFPFMIMLYFGLADLTGLVSLNRKITYAADVMADLVTRNDASILKSEVTDFYSATDLVMAPRDLSTVRVEVFGFRIAGSTVSQVWATNNAKGSSCGAAPSTAPMAALMTTKNDLVITRVCTTYTPYVANFLGQSILGASTFKVVKTVTRRPRSSLQLTCYQTVTNGAVCT
jgi:Flp pilus assembly protein TadG